jgi:hypothetical protein
VTVLPPQKVLLYYSGVMGSLSINRGMIKGLSGKEGVEGVGSNASAPGLHTRIVVGFGTRVPGAVHGGRPHVGV